MYDSKTFQSWSKAVDFDSLPDTSKRQGLASFCQVQVLPSMAKNMPKNMHTPPTPRNQQYDPENTVTKLKWKLTFQPRNHPSHGGVYIW